VATTLRKMDCNRLAKEAISINLNLSLPRKRWKDQLHIVG